MLRVFLAAGVAALAIATPALAGPGGHGGDQQHGGGAHGGGGGQPRGGGQPHGGGAPHGGGGAAFMGGGRGHGGGGPRFAAPQMRSQAMRGFARQQPRMAQRQGSRGFARQQFRGGRGQSRIALRQAHGFGRQQARSFAQHQGRGVNRQQMAQRSQRRSSNMQALRRQALSGRQLNGQRFARGAVSGNRFASQQLGGRQARFAAGQFANNRLGARQFGNRANFNAAPYSGLTYGNNVRVMPFAQANRFIGAPVAQVAGIAALAPLPLSLQYLYPETANYYYRYGDGYLYQVDRGTDLIAALIPLLAGGYLPGQYLPVAYMANYVPAYYGFNTFYADYGGLCNRYYGGVIYQVDCYSGYVEQVIPIYAGGYGVGQLLPTSYSYYNVPLQYRGLYYNTPDAGYWYSPGAIYQYDRHTDVITSVAALMGPGLAIGQPLPVGYSAYNVPFAYRPTYYDTPSAWYRYSNGYIYQIDPATQLVTAIVASLLT